MNYYGPCIACDSLGDTKVGSQFKTMVMLGFTVPRPMDVDTVRLFFITPAQQAKMGKTGYAGGSGGSFVIEVMQGGKCLAGGLLFGPEVWPAIKLDSLLHLEPSTSYTIEIRNMHEQYDLNYSAVNSLVAGAPTMAFPGHWVGFSSALDGKLVIRTGYMPIVALIGPGDAYSTAWIECEYAQVKPWAKEVITPKTDILVKALNIRTIGPVVNGTQTSQSGWSRCEYVAPIPHKAGVPFEIVVPAPMLPIRKGTVQGFPDPFPDGHAEFSADGKVWSVILGMPCDISVCLELA